MKYEEGILGGEALAQLPGGAGVKGVPAMAGAEPDGPLQPELFCDKQISDTVSLALCYLGSKRWHT